MVVDNLIVFFFFDWWYNKDVQDVQDVGNVEDVEKSILNKRSD